MSYPQATRRKPVKRTAPAKLLHWPKIKHQPRSLPIPRLNSTELTPIAKEDQGWQRWYRAKKVKQIQTIKKISLWSGLILPFLWWLNSSAFYDPLDNLLNPLKQEYSLRAQPTLTQFPLTSPLTSPWIRLNIQAGEDWDSIFKRYTLDQAQLSTLLTLASDQPALYSLHFGQELYFEHDGLGKIKQLILTLTPQKELYLQAQGSEFLGKMRTRDVQLKTVYHPIKQSLWTTSRQKGISDDLMARLIKLFRWQLDLMSLDNSAGDSFGFVYEQPWFEGGKQEGEILAAEYVHQGQVYRAVRYTNPIGESDYYTPEGNSLRKTFLTTPVDFTKISSHFGVRHHPILHKMRLHTGIDFAAPIGTPVTAAGSGTVTFIGTKAGYGKTIILEHGEHYRTLYAHLSRYALGLQERQFVFQEQLIGYVGKTGLATAPHLHYEFYLDGIQQDPQQANLPISMPIIPTYQDDFVQQTAPLIRQLEQLSLSKSLQLTQQTHR